MHCFLKVAGCLTAVARCSGGGGGRSPDELRGESLCKTPGLHSISGIVRARCALNPPLAYAVAESAPYYDDPASLRHLHRQPVSDAAGEDRSLPFPRGRRDAVQALVLPSSSPAATARPAPTTTAAAAAVVLVDCRLATAADLLDGVPAPRDGLRG